jgi:hypothetical protein
MVQVLLPFGLLTGTILYCCSTAQSGTGPILVISGYWMPSLLIKGLRSVAQNQIRWPYFPVPPPIISILGLLLLRASYCARIHEDHAWVSNLPCSGEQ